MNHICIEIGDIILDSGEEFSVLNRSPEILYLHSEKMLRHYRIGEIRILWSIPFHVIHSTDHLLNLSLSGTVWRMKGINETDIEKGEKVRWKKYCSE